MKNAFRFVFLAVIVALGVWLWLILFPGPEKMIRKQLAKLAQTVSFSSNEGNLVRMAGAENVGGFFSTNAEVNLDLPGREPAVFTGRAEVTQAALASRQATGSLIVKLLDVKVTVAPDKQSAVVDLTVETTLADERDPIIEPMRSTFQKIEGQWLITRVETVRTLP